MDRYKQVKKKEFYSDFHTNFLPHPDTQQLLRRTDADAIRVSIRNLLLTDIGERPFSDIGSNIKKSLFENFSPQMEDTLKEQIKQCLENYEPRAKIIEIFVKAFPDKNFYGVTIAFIPLAGSEVQQLNIRLFRVR